MSEPGRTVLIMAGGTGGHIFPALAIARSLQSRGCKTQWLGTRRGLEAQVLAGTGIELHFISVSGLRGKGFLKLLGAPLMIVIAVCQSMRIVLRTRPDCVLGMGGFVTGPGGLAARLLGKPLLIHEQNAVAGFSNRMLALLACRVMEAFPGAFKPKEKVVFTGNPVRADIIAIPAPAKRLAGLDGIEEKERPLRLLVLGGSLGAVAVNEVVVTTVGQLSSRERPEIWHQTGKNNFEQTVSFYREVGVTDLRSSGETSTGASAESDVPCRVEPFIGDMAAAYAWADLVICRAGATTVSELAAAGVASVLVPFPYAVDDHQTSNARWLSNAGAALLIQQSDLSAERLGKELRELDSDRPRLLQMAVAARSLARPDACEIVTNECIEACHAR